MEVGEIYAHFKYSTRFRCDVISVIDLGPWRVAVLAYLDRKS